jgi:multiple sugar transport system permease protein
VRIHPGGGPRSARLRLAARPLRGLAAVAFLAPALAALLVFFLLPVVAAFLLSLTDFDLYALADARNLRFVGLENYARLLRDPTFWRAFANTLVFVALGAPLSVGASFAAALLLCARSARAQAFFRTVYFLPVVTTLVAVAVVWRFLYHPRLGLANRALAWLGVSPVDWLGDPAWAMPAIILLAVWKNFGFNMVIFVAGLQSIPERLYEAARLDGATRWQQLRTVTLPMLLPTTTFVVLMTLIGHFQLFAEPYVMTQGGPEDSTRSLVLLLYEQGFRWWNLGQASAISVLLFAVVLVPTLLARAWRGREQGA